MTGPVDASVPIGGMAVFSVVVDFDVDGTITYEWLFSNIPLIATPSKYSGIDQASLLVLGVEASDVGQYTVRVTSNVMDTVMASAGLSICELRLLHM